MSKTFSSMTQNDENSITSALFPNLAANASISIEMHRAAPTSDRVTSIPDYLRQSLDNIESRWNLDRSEAARRTYIDLFLHEAINSTHANRRAIITVEENIPYSSNIVGHGRLDYIISAIDASTKTPIYVPSIVIEAKKSVSNNDIWQLLGAMVTVKQLAANSSQGSCPPGILTDGRYWIFCALSPVLTKAGKLDIYLSDALDTKIQNQLFNVVGILRHWVSVCGDANATFFGA